MYCLHPVGSGYSLRISKYRRHKSLIDSINNIKTYHDTMSIEEYAIPGQNYC